MSRISDGSLSGKLIDIDKLMEGYELDPKLQCLLLCFQFPEEKLDTDEAFDALMKYEDILRDIVTITEVGRVDGHEFCDGADEHSITFFIYGKDARKIYDVVVPVISYIPYHEGSYILMQFGGIDKHVEKIQI